MEQNVIFKRYSIERPLWPLDDRAKGLAASYSVDASTKRVATHDWAYERRWLRLLRFAVCTVGVDILSEHQSGGRERKSVNRSETALSPQYRFRGGHPLRPKVSGC